MLMRPPSISIGADSGKMASETLKIGVDAAKNALSQNRELAIIGAAATAALSLLIYTVTRTASPMIPPEKKRERPEADSSTSALSINDSTDRSRSIENIGSSSTVSILSQPGPEVIEAVKELRALPEEDRERILTALDSAATVGLEAVTAQLGHQGEESTSTAPSQVSSPLTSPPKTPAKVLNKATNLLKAALTPGRQRGIDPFSPSTNQVKLCFVTPQPPKRKSRARSRIPKKSETPPSKAEDGPNRPLVIFLAFTGVSFFAYTMAYGLPSFGKIKGWLGVAAA